VHGEPINLDPANAGLAPDVAGSAAATDARSANPITRLTSFFRSCDFPLAVGIDQATLAASLSAIAQQTAVAPVEGAVTIEGTTVRSVAPVIGRDLQVPEAFTAVSEAWRAGGPGLLEGLVLPVSGSPVRASSAKVDAATAEATLILSAPLVLVGQPSLTTEQAQALGIKQVIGEFTTGGFATASGVNIRVVAEKVNGAIVQPRATFGLNEYTGTRGVDQGYVPAGIIQEGALSTAVGGGISQFATTLYNAAYFAGVGDVTHTPHSFYISRYPAGREATVFDGEIELAFSNDYDTGVLIHTIWTDSDITVRLWGTKHVEVESISGDRFDFTSPQVVVKPYGQSCTPSGGTQGFSIVNTRVISDLAGAEIRREDFTTVYNGQQNVVCSPPPTPAVTPPVTATSTPAAAATDAAPTPGG